MMIFNIKNTCKIILLPVVVIGLLFLNAACGGSKSKIAKPNDLLERSVFEKTLLDMYLVEGFVRFKIRDVHHYDSLRVLAMTEINALYKKNKTHHEQFISSYTYYMNDPVISAEIMQNVVHQLVELQAKEEAKVKEKEKAKEKQDAQMQSVQDIIMQNIAKNKPIEIFPVSKIDTIYNIKRDSVNRKMYFCK